MNGIDISRYQKGINLAAVPCDFVIIKATQGTSYVSPEFKNYNPKSTYLQQFVKQSCKTAGERWIGLRKK